MLLNSISQYVCCSNSSMLEVSPTLMPYNSHLYLDYYNYYYYPCCIPPTSNTICNLKENLSYIYTNLNENTLKIKNCDRKLSVIKKVEKQKILEVNADEMITDIIYKSISYDSSKKNNSSIQEFICQWKNCLRNFEMHENLISHVKLSHAIESYDNLFYCKWDGCPRADRGFNARYKILVHIRTHTKEKPHQCFECFKSFSRAENLKIHSRTHSGEKPYICNFEGCNKAYSNSSDRFKHTRTHSVQKPYFCKVFGCNKRYTDPSSLRKHVKTFKHDINLNTILTLKKNVGKSNFPKYQYNINEEFLPLDLSTKRMINREK